MAAIPVRVEPPGENPVVEVSYDGQEVFKMLLPSCGDIDGQILNLR